MAVLNSRGKHWLALSVILALSGVFASSALAQSWSIKSGKNIGTFVPSDSRKLADGSTYVTGGSRVFVETEDPTYPITGQSMDCRWMCKIPASGKDGSCITLCAGVDKDGDLFSFRALAFGGGSYEVGPGTGKYAKASGGGTFESTSADDPALTVTRWKGTLQLK